MHRVVIGDSEIGFEFDGDNILVLEIDRRAALSSPELEDVVADHLESNPEVLEDLVAPDYSREASNFLYPGPGTFVRKL
jgi:hypothetical protein